MHVVFIVSINRKMKLLDPIEIYRKCSNFKKKLSSTCFLSLICLNLLFFLISWTFGSTYPFFLWVFNMTIWRLIEGICYFWHFGITLSSICLFLSNFAVSVVAGYVIVSLTFSYNFLTYLCYPSAPWPKLACVNVMPISTQLSITWQELYISARAHNSQHTTPNHHENIITAAAWK